MNKKVVIFGTGSIAQIANYYFEIDSDYDVVAFSVNKDYIESKTFENKPVVAFEEIENLYPPDKCSMFIAVSYSDMNRLRERIFHAAKEKAYNLASYVSSKCTYLSQYPPGENAFIFEDNTIQPFVSIGDNVTLWSGNHVGHHSTIDSHNFVSSQVVISGHCHVKSNCFLGVNSTVAHQVTLQPGTLLGAGVVLSKNSEEDGVYVAARPTKLKRSSRSIDL
jgi:sugar O-acyltransferase (sialic acid O-acetyltransferase NeuD family)